jgi:hypothetical protein
MRLQGWSNYPPYSMAAPIIHHIQWLYRFSYCGYVSAEESSDG